MNSRFAKNPAIWIAATALATAPDPARACGICVAAQLWDIFPPSLEWSLILSLWFLATAVLGRVHGARAFLVPGLRGTITYLVLSILAGPVFTGTFPFLLLIVPFVAGVIGLMLRRRQAFPPNFVRKFACVTIIAGIAMVASLVYEIRERSKITTADKIIMWSGAGWAGSLRNELIRREPRSLPDYRKIISKGWGYDVSFAAKRLGPIGDPALDLPLMRAALERIEQEQRRMASENCDFCKEAGADLREAMARLEARTAPPISNPAPGASSRPNNTRKSPEE